MGLELQKLPASRQRASSDPVTTDRKKFMHQLMRQHWRDNDDLESLEAVREQHAHDMADLQYINQDLTWDIQENLAHEREQTERAEFFQRMFESATQRLKIARTVRSQVLETLTSVRDTMDQLEMDILSMRQKNMRASEGTIEALRKGRDPSPHLSIPTEPWQSFSTEAMSADSAMESTHRTLDGELSNAWSFSRDSSGWSSSLRGSKPSPSIQFFSLHDGYPDEKSGEVEAVNRSLRSSLHVPAQGSPPSEAVMDAMHPEIAPLSLARAPGTVKSLRDGEIPMVVTPPNSALTLDIPSPGLVIPPPLFLRSPPRGQRNSPGKIVRVMLDSSGTPTEPNQEHQWTRSEGGTSDTSGSRLTASSNTSLVSISLREGSSKGAAKPADDDKSSNTSIRWSGNSMVSHGGPVEEKPHDGEERDQLVAGPMSLSEHLGQKIHQQSGNSAFSTSRADDEPFGFVKNGSVRKTGGEIGAAGPHASASERLVECLARVVMAIDEAQSERQTRGLSPFDFDLRAGPDGYVLIESGQRSMPQQSDTETPRSQRSDKYLPSLPTAIQHSTTTTTTSSSRGTTKNPGRKGLRVWLARVAASAVQLAICLVLFTLINVLIAIKEEWRCGNVSHVKRDEIMSWRNDLVGWDVIDWIRYRASIWLDANKELNV